MRAPHNVVPDYIAHGWKLCAVPEGSKGVNTPGWNLESNALKEAPQTGGIGLMHAYSGTAALDIDNLEAATAWLAERGVDLDALLAAPDAVQIVSGNAGHAKLLYALPSFLALPTKKILVGTKTILEFRCASANCKSVMDVLPPSRHPSGTTYQWDGSGQWQQLPDLPESLLTIWGGLVQDDVRQEQSIRDNPPNMDEVKSALFRIDPSCDRKTWVEVGMGLATVGEGGLQLWNEWSQQSAEKYPGKREMAAQWKSFKDVPNGITVGTLFHHAIAAGWQRPMPDMKFGPVPEPKRSVSCVQLVKGSDVKPENVKWLWYHWLAKGKIHIAAGAPGTGKTTIALRLAAIVSSGGVFPDGVKVDAGNVLIWSGEDAIADTLIPRLMAAGANLQRIHFVNEIRQGEIRIAFDPAVHMPQLEAAAKQLGDVSLLIVDSIADVIAGDSHKNAEVRRGLRPLADFGLQTDCAVFGIAHFNKGSGGRDPLERVMGSAAFGAVARIVYGCARIVENDVTLRRVFARAKSNIGPDGDGFEYSIQMVTVDGGIEASKVEFGQPIVGSAKEILGSPDESGKPDGGNAKVKQERAKTFLREILKDGDVLSNTIRKDGADQFDLSWATLRRAKDEMGISSIQIGSHVWVWRLPPEIPDFPDMKQKGE